MPALPLQRPSLFIGSSTEGRYIADAIEFNLAADAEVTTWPQGVFVPNHGYLESLVNALDRFDFAILVLTPDDVVSERDAVVQVPRANVMFELGLFMGRLGRNRTFAVCSDDPAMRLPSDLAGASFLSFQANRFDRNWNAATSPACSTIRKHIREMGTAEARTLKRLSTATETIEGVTNQFERIIYLMARSRVLELDLIQKQFGLLLPPDFVERLTTDLNALKAETEPKSPVTQ